MSCGELITSFITTYQAGLGALLGLFGVAAATIYNRRVQQNRDDKLRLESEHSIARALLTEIKVDQEPLGKRRDEISRWLKTRPDEDDVFELGEKEYWISGARIFDSVSHDLGLLPEHLAAEIAEYYLLLNRVYGDIKEAKQDVWEERLSRAETCQKLGESLRGNIVAFLTKKK